jgi:hypothetical protein
MVFCELRLRKDAPEAVRQARKYVNLGFVFTFFSQNFFIQQSYISPSVGSGNNEIGWG